MKRKQEIGVVGLGKMGFSVSKRLRDKNYQIVGFDLLKSNRDSFVSSKMLAADCLDELCDSLTSPRVIMLLLPAGKAISDTIDTLTGLLNKDDIVLDFGNSYYKDALTRSTTLNKHGIHFMDVGLSGGVGVSEQGACLTIGGKEQLFKDLEYLFHDISTENGYMYTGPSGWGHLVKTIHNGIEYGFLQAIGEGLNVVNKIAEKEGVDFDLSKLCETWAHGSIIESKLIKNAAKAIDLLNSNPSIEGIICGGETGTWAKEIAEEIDVPMPALKIALDSRKESRLYPSFAGKVIAAIRNVFGGHDLINHSKR